MHPNSPKSRARITQKKRKNVSNFCFSLSSFRPAKTPLFEFRGACFLAILHIPIKTLQHHFMQRLRQKRRIPFLSSQNKFHCKLPFSCNIRPFQFASPAVQFRLRMNADRIKIVFGISISSRERKTGATLSIVFWPLMEIPQHSIVTLTKTHWRKKNYRLHTNHGATEKRAAGILTVNKMASRTFFAFHCQ